MTVQFPYSRKPGELTMSGDRRSFLEQLAGSVFGALTLSLGAGASRAQDERRSDLLIDPDRPRRGLALVIGLNSVDPGHYAGWPGTLRGAEFDADDIERIAQASGFEVQKLLTMDATRPVVLRELNKAAERLRSNDLFLLYFAGMGGKLPDENGDEMDGEDETWCLFDGQLVDDEIHGALARFALGVRILCVWDTSNLNISPEKDGFEQLFQGMQPDRPYRAMPPELPRPVYRKNRTFYDGIIADLGKEGDQTPIRASVISLGACQDNQLSVDGPNNGLFTANLTRVWSRGAFQGDYRSFHKAILMRMPARQSPSYGCLGTPNPEFGREKPFKV